jgi:hypothetical protein
MGVNTIFSNANVNNGVNQRMVSCNSEPISSSKNSLILFIVSNLIL